MKKIYKTIAVSPFIFTCDPDKSCCDELNKAYAEDWQFLEAILCGDYVLYTLTKLV